MQKNMNIRYEKWKSKKLLNTRCLVKADRDIQQP